MSDAPRTLDELIEHYIELGPGWQSEPEELLHAQIASICASKELAEKFIYALWDQTFITRAAQGYLDIHGRERGIHRFDGETDADYLIRIRKIEDQLTVPAILNAVNPLLAIGEARLEEWLFDAAWSFLESSYGPPPVFEQPKRGFSDVSFAGSEAPGFTIYIEDQVAEHHQRSFPGQIPYATDEEAGFFAWNKADTPVSVHYGFSETEELFPSSIYKKVDDTVARLRAAGVQYRIEIAAPIPEVSMGLFGQSVVSKNTDQALVGVDTWNKILNFTVGSDVEGVWDGTNNWWDFLVTPHPTTATFIKLQLQIQFENTDWNTPAVVNFGIGLDGSDPDTSSEDLFTTLILGDEKGGGNMASKFMATYFLPVGHSFDLWAQTDLPANVNVAGGLGSWFSCELWKP